MNEKKEGSLSLLRRYQKELMGLSVLSVLLSQFFTDIRKANLGGFRTDIANVYQFFIRHKGTDIIIFLFAVGLCYYMNKNRRILPFYAHCAKLVLIPYLIIGSLYWPLTYLFVSNKGLVSFLSDWTLLSFWTKGTRSAWFVAFLAVMCLVYPFLFRLFHSCRTKKQSGGVICFAIITLLSALFFFLKGWAPNRYAYLEICLWRTCAFVLGAYIGERAYQGEHINTADLLVLFGAFDLLLLRALSKYKLLRISVNDVSFTKLTNGFWFVCFSSLAILFLMVMSVHVIRRHPVRAFLRVTGSISLELYITHIMVRDFFVKALHLKPYRISTFLAYLFVSVILSLLLHMASDVIYGKLEKKHPKN